MNRPSLLTRILGSLPVCLMLIATAIGMTYVWWTQPDQVSGWVPILALFMGSAAANAAAEVDRYQQWKRAWNAMAGPPAQQLRRPRHGFKAVCLLLLVAGLAYWLGLHPPHAHPSTEEQAAIIGLVLALLALLYQCAQWQRHRPARQSTSKKAHVVSLCLPVPKKCDPLPPLAMLPSHCQALWRPN